jgi:hypothetical protein
MGEGVEIYTANKTIMKNQSARRQQSAPTGRDEKKSRECNSLVEFSISRLISTPANAHRELLLLLLRYWRKLCVRDLQLKYIQIFIDFSFFRESESKTRVSLQQVFLGVNRVFQFLKVFRRFLMFS